jgi:crossover junction endodeoxyribonuclease RuvC
MRVLGIDLGCPGGLAVLEDGTQAGRVLHWQCLGRSVDLARLQSIVDNLIEKFQVVLVATERPYTGWWDRRPRVGMAQREKQGVVRAVCQARGIRLVDFQPQTVKKALTGDGRAPKAAVVNHVRCLLGIEGGEHVADAAAIALTAMNRERASQLIAAQKRLRVRRSRRQQVKQP